MHWALHRGHILLALIGPLLARCGEDAQSQAKRQEKKEVAEKAAAEQSAKWKAEREAEASLMADPIIRAQT